MWTRFSQFAPLGKGFLGAILGTALVLGLLHAYTDHQALHQIIALINAQAAKAAQAPK